jgi:hypothetical protein
MSSTPGAGHISSTAPSGLPPARAAPGGSQRDANKKLSEARPLEPW